MGDNLGSWKRWGYLPSDINCAYLWIYPAITLDIFPGIFLRNSGAAFLSWGEAVQRRFDGAGERLVRRGVAGLRNKEVASALSISEGDGKNALASYPPQAAGEGANGVGLS
jgi:hypothetical protein